VLATASATAVFAKDAEYSAVKIEIENGREPHPLSCSHRGNVNGFSRKSRKRLFDLLASIPNSVLNQGVLFVTLTYPGEYPSEHEIYKSHLRAFLKRLYRKIGKKTPILWRLEFQERGAPHFHLLVFGVKRLDLEWVSQSWYEVVESNDEKHLLAGTNVKFIRDRRAIVGYVSKYVAKVSLAKTAPTGRVWGVWAKDLLGICIVKIAISAKTAIRIRELMLSFLESRGVVLDSFAHWGISSLTCYGFPLQEYIGR
jgi:hypothetical protein